MYDILLGNRTFDAMRRLDRAPAPTATSSLPGERCSSATIRFGQMDEPSRPEGKPHAPCPDRTGSLLDTSGVGRRRGARAAPLRWGADLPGALGAAVL